MLFILETFGKSPKNERYQKILKIYMFFHEKRIFTLPSLYSALPYESQERFAPWTPPHHRVWPTTDSQLTHVLLIKNTQTALLHNCLLFFNWFVEETLYRKFSCHGIHFFSRNGVCRFHSFRVPKLDS